MSPKETKKTPVTPIEPEEKAPSSEPSESNRLASKLGVGGGFEGEPIEKTDIENQEVILVDFKIAPSQYKEANFAMLQLEVDGALRTCNIGGQVIVEALEKIQGDKASNLPAEVIFFKAPTKDGKRSYWTMK